MKVIKNFLCLLLCCPLLWLTCPIHSVGEEQHGKEYQTEELNELIAEMAGEGMVLLENNGALPLSAGTKKIALYGGNGSVATAIAGTGAEATYPDRLVTIYEALQTAGYTITSRDWIERFKSDYDDAAAKWEFTAWDHLRLDEPAITQEDIQAASAADTAIYVVRRIAGEGTDRTNTKGSYLLADVEYQNLQLLSESFDKVIVLLNVCDSIDTSFYDEIDGLDAMLLVSLGGSQIGTVVADILSGKINPSGKLTASWVGNYKNYPSKIDSDTALYTDDIYVGYRYFETFDPECVQYCFGMGLSYTSFDIRTDSVKADGNEISVTATVTNTGKVAGKEVVQVYYSAPNGLLGKPAIELAAFAKTEMLAAGGSQSLTIRFAIDQMASYDDTGKTGNASCYVLEAGDYVISVGNSVRDAAAHPVYTHSIGRLSVTQRCTQYAASDKLTQRLYNDGSGTVQYEAYQNAGENNPLAMTTPVDELVVEGDSFLSFSDVLEDSSLLDSFVGQMTNEELIQLVMGHPGSFGSGNVGGLERYGLPEAVTNDGVSGVHQSKRVGFPSPLCMAQSWNTELIRRVAEANGAECIRTKVDFLLGPGANILRNPLCGRNFGYYAEDPLLSGEMGAAYCSGLESNGVVATLKHFACNNQETNRGGVSAELSERALREIYLKSFQYIIERGSVHAIMTSYNKINGTEAAERGDILQGIVRDEWGFEGLIMTDWGNDSDETTELIAGNNLKMPGGTADKLERDIADGTLARGQLQYNARQIVFAMTLLSSAKNTAVRCSKAISDTMLTCLPMIEYDTVDGDFSVKACHDEELTRQVVTVSDESALVFHVKVNSSGTYSFCARAKANDGHLDLYVDDDLTASSDKIDTGGTWQTLPMKALLSDAVYLERGIHTIWLQCQGSELSLNWLKIEPLSLPSSLVSIEQPDAKTVAFGTKLDQLGLPGQLEVTFQDGSREIRTVVWDTVTYDPFREGSQTVLGTIQNDDLSFSNHLFRKAIVSVTVGQSSVKVTGVRVSASASEAQPGEHVTLSALVDGVGVSQDVVWSVDSDRSSIDSKGMLTVGESESAATLTVTARASQNEKVFDTYIISITGLRRYLLQDGSTTAIKLSAYDSANITLGTEGCSDSDGGVNLINWGDGIRLEYEVNAVDAGSYAFTVRYANPTTDANKSAELWIDGSQVGAFSNLAYSGGWQSWCSSETVRVSLEAGKHSLSFRCRSNGINFNRLDVTAADKGAGVNGGVFVGRVTNTLDGAMRDVKVTLSDGVRSVCAMTDANGRYTFQKLNDVFVGDTVTATVSKDFYEPQSRQVTLSDSTADFQLLQRSVTVTGSVTLDGKALAGCPVILRAKGRELGIASALTASDGSFILSADGYGEYEMCVYPDRYESNAAHVVISQSESLSVGVLAASKRRVLLYGDVDGNTAINASDALLALQHSVSLTRLTEQQQMLADMNEDGRIDAQDALEMLQISVGLK